MNILVGCEFSGLVRDAFINLGHNAWSCDIEPSEKPGRHIQDNILNHLDDNWDMFIAFPPCTYICNSGARWIYEEPNRIQKQIDALVFVKTLMDAPIDKICIENPIGKISTNIKKPTQIIQPYEFGHDESKATCLWLKNLPPLKPTKIVDNYYPMVHYGYLLYTKKDRSRERSRTYPGIAQAMAEQWSNL